MGGIVVVGLVDTGIKQHFAMGDTTRPLHRYIETLLELERVDERDQVCFHVRGVTLEF